MATETEREIRSSWKEIELPEVIGRIKPTKIAKEPDIIDKDIILEIKEDEGNDYDIYKLNNNMIVDSSV